MDVPHLHPLVAVPVVAGVLLLGSVVAHVLHTWLGGRVAAAGHAMDRPSLAAATTTTLRRWAVWATRPASLTERPDVTLWVVAPAAYAALAAVALAVVPLGEGLAVADVRTGIVVFGAAEALAIVAVYLHGWSPNSALPLIGGYRFVAQALSYALLSMFVLIAAALPAESMSVGDIVASQADLWNVVRHPLSLPLWLVVAAGVTFWGPLDAPDRLDLAGGTDAEASGPARLVWQVGRGAMLTAFAAMGAAAFLGGWHGPLLPGPVWMPLKTLGLIAAVTWLGHRLGHVPTERFVTVAWTVLLPLAFLDLVIAGLEALP